MKFRRNTTCFPYGCIIVFLFVVAVFAGCGGSSGKRISFSRSDLEGNWSMIHLGQALYGPFSGAGSLAINSSGAITGGKVRNFGVDDQKVTGGAFAITPEGIITGAIEVYLPDSNTYEKKNIYSGRMLLNKNIILFAASLTLGRKGTGILVKEEGGYVSSDLNGTWVFPLEGVFAFSVNNSADIADCMYRPVVGDPETCRGTISVMPDGNVSGKIDFADETPFAIQFKGRMSSDKSGMILWGGMSTRFEGMATLAVKKGVEFSPARGKGKWDIFISAVNDVLYGTIDIDDSGTVTGGAWKNSQKTSGTFTGGNVIYSRDRNDISGFISTSSGHNYTILGGALSSSGDVLPVSAKDEAGHEGMLVLVEDSSKQ
jgi:hypothetical protein